jgi:NADH:ubiquinone oxidoreductase subunit 2 (subunit N)
VRTVHVPAFQIVFFVSLLIFMVSVFPMHFAAPPVYYVAQIASILSVSLYVLIYCTILLLLRHKTNNIVESDGNELL